MLHVNNTASYKMRAGNLSDKISPFTDYTMLAFLDPCLMYDASLIINVQSTELCGRGQIQVLNMTTID